MTMRFSRILLSSVLLALLASCQTMTPEERRAVDEKTCASYGFRPNTDAMARCLLDLDLDRRAQTRSMMDRNDAMFWGPTVIVTRPVYVHRP
jgi:hypothetical protein